MPYALDEWLMWIFYLVQVIGCIMTIVYSMQMGDEVRSHDVVTKALEKRFQYIETLSVVTSATNLVAGVILSYYFAVLSNDVYEHFISERGPGHIPLAGCEHQRLGNAPHRRSAMWAALLITGAGGAYLSLCFSGGVSSTLGWCIDDLYTIMGETDASGAIRVVLRDYQLWIMYSQGAIVIGVVVTLYIGHAWSVLRSKCLKEYMAASAEQAASKNEGARRIAYV